MFGSNRSRFADAPALTEIKASGSGDGSSRSRIDQLCDGDWGDDAGTVAKLKAEAVAGELTEIELASSLLSMQRASRNKVELDAIRASRPQGPTGHTTTRTPRGTGVANVLEASLLLSAGIDADFIAGEMGEQTVDQAMSATYRDLGISGLMRAIAYAGGESAQGGENLVRAAFRAEQSIKASGVSTLSLPGILGNAANKAMLAEYRDADTTWRMFCDRGSAADFKVSTQYRLTLGGSFEKVGADGELKHGTLSESSYSRKIDTYGMMLGLTRQDLINDDVSAFLAIPRSLGRASAVRVEEAVYVELLGNSGSFYGAGNNNLLTGADTALSIDSLTRAKTVFRHRVDDNGKPLLVRPDVLLVPPELESTASVLLREQRITDPTDTTVSTAIPSVPAMNPHAGTLKLGVSPYLSNAAIKDESGKALSNQSDSAWYLFARPTSVASIAVSFLSGRETPTIESTEMDFNMLGMQWRAYHDFGVSLVDSVGSVKATGEA